MVPFLQKKAICTWTFPKKLLSQSSSQGSPSRVWTTLKTSFTQHQQWEPITSIRNKWDLMALCKSPEANSYLEPPTQHSKLLQAHRTQKGYTVLLNQRHFRIRMSQDLVERFKENCYLFFVFFFCFFFIAPPIFTNIFKQILFFLLIFVGSRKITSKLTQSSNQMYFNETKILWASFSLNY